MIFRFHRGSATDFSHSKLMHDSILERRIACPFCAENVSILLDLSAGDQEYIEDCQVCCQPIQICYQTDGQSIDGIQISCGS